MKKLLLTPAALLAIWSAPSLAQTSVPFVPQQSFQVTLSPTNTNFGISGMGPTALLQNIGSQDTFCQANTGASASSTRIAAGASVVFNVSQMSNISCYIASGSTILNVTMGTGMPMVTSGSVVSGPGGSAIPVTAPVGTANFATAQVAMSTSATLIVAARTGAAGTGRSAVTVQNTSGGTLYVGLTSGVTTSTGFPVFAGASLTLPTQAAVYGILATGTGTASEVETY